MKKVLYVKPALKVVEFNSSVLMNATSSVSFRGGDGAQQGEVREAESQGRRGGWGDLWQ